MHLKQPDIFAGKVLGSYVRTKSDPNDYLQKNSHLLLEVTGNLDLCLKLTGLKKSSIQLFIKSTVVSFASKRIIHVILMQFALICRK